MAHPDLAIVQAEQQGGVLKVDQVRELQRSLALAPYEAIYRVAVLLRFEEANASSMNALLKTLEEPAPQVVLILTAESAEMLLPTIVSRCEVMRLRPVPLDQLSRSLQERGVPAERAQLLSHISGGRPGYALRLEQEAELLEQRKNWLEMHATLLAANRVERFAQAETLAKDKDSLRASLLVWLSFWRDVLIRSAGASAPITNLDYAHEIEDLAERLGLLAARRMIVSLERVLNLLDRNINARLAAEVLVLDLPRK
jgi:DNA polymerase-3 subunit delta'